MLKDGIVMPWLKSDYIIRSIPTDSQAVFLTFDDGPDPLTTPLVGQLLLKNKVQATFFVIVNRVKESPRLLRSLQSEGHQIFSHSTDHKFHNFFKSKRVLKKWVLDSVDEIQQITGQNNWGFRPPAGVITPPLVEIAEEEELPLYMWKHRFYDTTQVWKTDRAEESLKFMNSGDIVLLHDSQKNRNRNVFLNTLEYYVVNLKARGFQAKAIQKLL